MSGLKDRYKEKIIPALKEKFGFTNLMQVPRLQKIVINMGVGVGGDRDDVKNAADELARITGQRPVITKSRNAISNFKLREGMDLGCKVTLRGERMYEFLERLVSVGLPRIRDFRGISPKGFDGRGNYSFGLTEQTIFPEIDADRVKRTQGMDICFVTSAKTNDEGRELLKLLGLPFSS
ncbi:MAG: 50S ribosomal protein L5 [Kiritimatiellia bacterium]